MVDRLTNPGGQEENQPTESTPKPESALQKHLRRLGIFGESKKDTTESDEDDEESDKPKKKFRKFFEGLFKNIVEAPEFQDSKTPKRPNLESLFFGWQEPEAKDTLSDEVEPREQENEAPLVHTVGESKPEVVEPLPADSNPYFEAYEEPVVEEQPVPAVREALPNPVQPDVAREFTPSPVILERPPVEPVEKEVIIKRGPGIALPVAFVGAEYLARKRADRKLDAKFSEKTETLEKTVKQGDIAREQLDSIVKQNREQLEKLKRERMPILEKQPVFSTEKQQKTEQLTRAEAPKPQARVERIESAVQEQEIAHREQYKIMEQVANAAEHDVPVEIAFERSHEVKDDMSNPTTAASIGAIMAAQADEQRRVARIQAVQHQMSDTPQSLPVVNDSQTSDMYQQAMKRGFWAAICIIILGMIAYLVK